MEDPNYPNQPYPNPNQQGYGQYYGSTPNNPTPVKPDNNMALAIITTVCCCLPFGIVAIVKASQVNSLYFGKQYAAAQQAAKDAKTWSLIGIAVGAVICLGYIALGGLSALTEYANY